MDPAPGRQEERPLLNHNRHVRIVREQRLLLAGRDRVRRPEVDSVAMHNRDWADQRAPAFGLRRMNSPRRFFA